MDFLEKMTKKFMVTNSSRDTCTLANLKTIIQRSSVNGNVKSRYHAHEDFSLLVGEAYLTEAAMMFFGIEDLSGSATKHSPPENIEYAHNKKKTEAYKQAMDAFLTSVMMSQSFKEEAERKDSIQLNVAGVNVQVRVEGGFAIVPLKVGYQSFEIRTPISSFKAGGIAVNLPMCGVVNISPVKPDDLHNYILNYLQYYFLFIFLKDAIAEGDIRRINVGLKHLIPFFYNHSPLSKYMVECIDYILKTEILLSPIRSIQVQTSALVNPKGRKGHNKPMDMQKENQVKKLKELIKGLGANKTETSIVNISKAGPVIDHVVNEFDKDLGFVDHGTTHKKRSTDEDLLMLLTTLREAKALVAQPGRELKHYRLIKDNVFAEIGEKQHHLTSSIMSVAERLKKSVPVDVEEDLEEMEDQQDGDEEI